MLIFTTLYLPADARASKELYKKNFADEKSQGKCYDWHIFASLPILCATWKPQKTKMFKKIEKK